MPRRSLVHRDTMLEQVGYMPARKAGESNESFEHRKLKAATEAARNLDLDQYPIPGKRALRYDQAQVDREAQKIKPLQRAA